MLPAAWARSQPTTAPAAWPGRGQPFDLERLAGREVDPGQEDEREVVGLVGDGRFQVLGPDDRAHRRAGRRRPGPSSGSSPRWARWLVRACRSDGKSGPSARIRRRRPLGPEERGEQEMDVDGQAVEQRHLDRARPDDPAHRLAQRPVQREPRSRRVEPGVDAQARPGVQLGRDRRGRGPRLQPERLARQVDRGRSVGRRRDVEPVARRRRQRRGRVARPARPPRSWSRSPLSGGDLANGG